MVRKPGMKAMAKVLGLVHAVVRVTEMVMVVCVEFLRDVDVVDFLRWGHRSWRHRERGVSGWPRCCAVREDKLWSRDGGASS